MPASLSYELHKLTSRLDRAADQVLRREAGITYARFIALFAVQQGAQTQRELAAWLGVTEPSVSRMARVLTADGFLEVSSPAGAGNRRSLRLSSEGTRLVKRCSRALEGRFVRLVQSSGVPFAEYHAYTVALIQQLEAEGIGPLVEESET